MLIDTAVNKALAADREDMARARQGMLDSLAPLRRELDELGEKVAGVMGVLLHDQADREKQVTRIRVLRNEAVRAAQDIAEGRGHA